MYVHLYVSPAAAVLAGKARSGNLRMDLTEEQIQSLGEEERMMLATVSGLGEEELDADDTRLGAGDDPDIPDASLESLRTVLQARIQKARVRAEEERTRQEQRRRISDARERAERMAAEREREYREARAEMIQMVGGPDEIGCFKDGLMSEEAADSIVRDCLFSRFRGIPRFRRLSGRDVKHRNRCQFHDEVIFRAEDAESLTPGAWCFFDDIRRGIAGSDVTITPRVHTATCGNCDARATRYSAKVDIEWHHRTFTREYNLD
jgi:hypothetical protein